MNKLSTPVNNLWTTRRCAVKVIHIVALYLTRGLRSMLAGEPLPRIARRLCLVLLAGLFVFGNTTNATAVNTPKDINSYKLYTHMKLIDAKQYRCVELLWNRESRWDPRANNPRSSAYGIPQLLHMKVLDPYRQIDMGLKYIEHRYKTPCAAWAHHRSKGHY